MRYVWIVIVVIFAILALVALGNKPPGTVTLPPIPTVTPTQPALSKTINFKNEIYAYEIARVADASRVTLLPNFQQKKTAAELISSSQCQAAINGSFYDTKGQPLGFFLADGTVLHASSINALINGYISIDESNNVVISSAFPNGKLTVGLQSGPLLFLDNKPLPLRIKSDEPARRMVALTTASGELAFIALFAPSGVFSGPLLGDVPLVLVEVAKNEKLHIGAAINLDGGSASFFTNGTMTLSELTSVGSLFCVR